VGSIPAGDKGIKLYTESRHEIGNEGYTRPDRRRSSVRLAPFVIQRRDFGQSQVVNFRTPVQISL
jgi:hypothetical protein